MFALFVVYCKASGYGSIPAAVYSRFSDRTVYVDTPLTRVPQASVDIDSGDLPLALNFRSRSSRITASQSNIGQPGYSRSDSSVDEPIRLNYQITRPVQQEVREIVVPTRNIVQEVRPVQENVERIVSTGRGVGFTGAAGNGNGTGFGGRYGNLYGYGK